MTETVRINIIVEGPTEETFVRDILAPSLGAKGVGLVARAVKTGRRHGITYRGGMTSYERAKRDIARWLGQDRTAYVTTMFDYYGLPADFPGREHARPTAPPLEKVRAIEAAMRGDVGSNRFLPHLQLHEFEAMLFSDVRFIDDVLRPYSGTSRVADLREIRSRFETPEDIDDGVSTAPSKRLLDLYPAYDKVAHGSRIAHRLGVDRIGRECPHFREWLAALEELPPLTDR